MEARLPAPAPVVTVKPASLEPGAAPQPSGTYADVLSALQTSADALRDLENSVLRMAGLDTEVGLGEVEPEEVERIAAHFPEKVGPWLGYDDRVANHRAFVQRLFGACGVQHPKTWGRTALVANPMHDVLSALRWLERAIAARGGDRRSYAADIAPEYYGFWLDYRLQVSLHYDQVQNMLGAFMDLHPEEYEQAIAQQKLRDQQQLLAGAGTETAQGEQQPVDANGVAH